MLNRWLATSVVTLSLVFGSSILAAAETINWSPFVEMDRQLFPSFLIATATMRFPENKIDDNSLVLGDPRSMLGVAVTAPEDGTEVTVEIAADEIMDRSTHSATLAKAGTTYIVCPKIKYKFAALHANKQLTPLTVSFKLTVNDQVVGEKAETVTLRSVNDCLFGVQGEGDKPENFTDLSFVFAAYVNEEHPQIDSLLKEALETGLVDSFTGYQSEDPAEVYLQVYAVWQALENRGFRYSDVSTTAAQSNKVYSQNVRFLDDSINAGQSNCVDGTVLMASVLRRIGIEPILVMVPGHCFLGFYLDAEQSDFAGLECTMLSSGDDIEEDEFDEIEGLNELVDDEQLEEPSWRSFNAAVMTGTERMLEEEEKFDSDDPSYQLINILTARQMGIVPIAFKGKQ
jgi:hypothetical protein